MACEDRHPQQHCRRPRTLLRVHARAERETERWSAAAHSHACMLTDRWKGDAEGAWQEVAVLNGSALSFPELFPPALPHRFQIYLSLSPSFSLLLYSSSLPPPLLPLSLYLLTP